MFVDMIFCLRILYPVFFTVFDRKSSKELYDGLFWKSIWTVIQLMNKLEVR